MTRQWAVRLDRTEVDSLRTLRLISGAEMCEQDGDIWVRGPVLDEALAHLLRKHPHAQRYWILPDRQLQSPEKMVPNGYLPSGPWRPLRDWLTVTLPMAAFAGRLDNPWRIQLVRASVVCPSNVLITNIADWSAYGTVAPKVRLDRWYFAVAGDGRVVVRGAPLPPLPGNQWAEDRGIGIPAGWKCDLAVPTEVLCDVFQIQDRDLVLLGPEGTYERIRGDYFVRASRSAIRMTAREFADA